MKVTIESGFRAAHFSEMLRRGIFRRQRLCEPMVEQDPAPLRERCEPAERNLLVIGASARFRWRRDGLLYFNAAKVCPARALCLKPARAIRGVISGRNP